MCENCQNEKFNTRIYNQDESGYVDASFTYKEIRDTAAAISNRAVEKKDRDSLLVASVMALPVSHAGDLAKKLCIANSRLEAFREAVQEALENEKAEDLKDVILGLIDVDKKIGNLALQLVESGAL